MKKNIFKIAAVFAGGFFTLMIECLAVSRAYAGIPPIPPPAPAAATNNWTAPDGGVRQSSSGGGPTYQSDTGLFTPAANPTDVWALYGSNQFGPTIYLKQVRVSCLSTSGGSFPVLLQSTNSANISTGSYTTLTTATGYMSKRDAFDPNPSATAQYWTANPTARTGVSSSRSLISQQDIVCGTNGANAGTPVIFDFTGPGAKPFIQRYGVNYPVAVNLNGVALPAGAQLRIEAVWEEQKQVNVCMVGDSTTAVATAGYFNGSSSYLGGLSKTGAMNSVAAVFNLGSNGFRLADILNDLNGVTWPLGQVLGSGMGSPSTTSALQTGNYYQNCDVLVLTIGINDVRQGLLGTSQAVMQNRLVSMLDAFIYAVKNGTVLGASYTSPLAASYAVSNISWASNVATVTTSAPHQFSTAGSGESFSGGGVAVTISGSSNAAFNGTWQLGSVIDATHFTVNMATDPGVFSGTAREQAATIWYGTFSAMPGAKVILYSPNSLTADDSASGSGGAGYYMDYPQTSAGTLVGVWSGMTLAQAAQAASNILFNAYASFSGDPRLFAVIHQQSVGGGPFPSTVTTLANNPLMMNQLHPGSYGQWLKNQQISPVIVRAVSAVAATRY
jgi:hypothetical protein